MLLFLKMLLLRDKKMPSQKPRIALTIDDDLNEVLEGISKLTGTPKSKIIVSFLHDLMPIFKELLESLQHIEKTKDALPMLAKWSAMANHHTSIINNEMADLYKKESEK